jgi:hypothetical protein
MTRMTRAGSSAKYNMAKITVKIEDGMVQAVEGIPADVTIEVRNYDVGGVDEKVITKDEKEEAPKFASGVRRNNTVIRIARINP